MARTSQKDPFLCVKAGVVEGTESFETHCCLKRRASRLETEGMSPNDTNKSKRLVCACKGRRHEWREKERHEQMSWKERSNESFKTRCRVESWVLWVGQGSYVYIC